MNDAERDEIQHQSELLLSKVWRRMRDAGSLYPGMKPDHIPDDCDVTVEELRHRYVAESRAQLTESLNRLYEFEQRTGRTA